MERKYIRTWDILCKTEASWSDQKALCTRQLLWDTRKARNLISVLPDHSLPSCQADLDTRFQLVWMDDENLSLPRLLRTVSAFFWDCYITWGKRKLLLAKKAQEGTNPRARAASSGTSSPHKACTQWGQSWTSNMEGDVAFYGSCSSQQLSLPPNHNCT